MLWHKHVLRVGLAAGLLLVWLVPGFATPRRTALVIGNAAYRESRLRNPVNDATDIAATLRQLEFDVTLLRDTSLQKMEDPTHLTSYTGFLMKLRGVKS